MGLFAFFTRVLLIFVLVGIAWPLNIPLAALACKIYHGRRKIDLETGAFWWRSTFASLGLAGVCLAMIVLNYITVRGMGIPSGPVHLSLLMAYIAYGAWFMFLMYALEDMVQGLGVFLAYVLIPGLPLLFLGWIFPRLLPSLVTIQE